MRVLAMVVLRLVPVAPFTLVNLVAGASRIRLRDCLLGTAIGMTPGILITASLVDRIAAVAKDPGAGTFALLALVLLIPITVAVLLRRRRKRRERAANAELHAAATADGRDSGGAAPATLHQRAFARGGLMNAPLPASNPASTPPGPCTRTSPWPATTSTAGWAPMGISCRSASRMW